MLRLFHFLFLIPLAFFSSPVISQTAATAFKPTLNSPESVGISSSRLTSIDKNIQVWINKGSANNNAADKFKVLT